jgi:hypothetical protein
MATEDVVACAAWALTPALTWTNWSKGQFISDFLGRKAQFACGNY